MKKTEKKHIWNPDELQTGQEMIGEIVAADWKNSDYGGEQLCFQIKALDMEVGGETGLMWDWYSYSTRLNSKYGTLITALKNDCRLKIESEKDLVGKTFRWEHRVLKFGEMETKETWIPVELVEDEKTGHDFSGLHELLEEGISKKEIIKWARKHGIPKKDVNEYLEGLTLTEEDGELFLDE